MFLELHNRIHKKIDIGSNFYLKVSIITLVGILILLSLNSSAGGVLCFMLLMYLLIISRVVYLYLSAENNR